MRPVLFELGPFAVHAYSVCMVVGVVLVGALATSRLARAGSGRPQCSVTVEVTKGFPTAKYVRSRQPGAVVGVGLWFTLRRYCPEYTSEAKLLVTGGLGVVGGLVARHLARAHGVGHLVLLGRRGEDSPGVGELRRDLEASGCAVTVAACDAADRDELAAVLAAVPEDRPLTAVVHAAGALDDAMVESLTPEHVARVMRPKLDAARNLDELTAALDLTAFVLFSSASGTFGSPGQANYAAANAALDALAQRRRAAGRPAQSLAGGFWAEASGMTGHLDEADVARLRRLGMVPLTNERGLDLFDAALAGDAALALPVGLDTAALRSQARMGLLPALFRGLVQAPARRQRQGAGSLSRRLAAAPAVTAALVGVTGDVRPASSLLSPRLLSTFVFPPSPEAR